MATSDVYAAMPEEAVQQTEKTLTVSGVAYDAATRTPLAGVRIVAHGNAKYSVMTNETGA